MSYKDEVLKSRPGQYYTLDNDTDGWKDLSGYGNDMTTHSFQYFSVIVPGSNSCIPHGTIPNPMHIFSAERQHRDFTIEFWTNPWMSGGDYYTIMSSSGGSIQWNSGNMQFYVSNSGDPGYYPTYNTTDKMDERMHVVAIYVKNSVVLIINGNISHPTALPDDFNFTAIATTMSCYSSVMSHLAIYDRSLTLEEINAHYAAGTKNWNYKAVCMNDGADFFGMSSQNVKMAFNHVIDSTSWTSGVFNNTTIDRDGWIGLNPQDDLIVYESNGTRSNTRTLSFSTGFTPVSGQYMVKADPLNALSNGAGIIAVNFTSAAAPATKKVLMTIVNKNTNRSWCWYINSSNILKLDVVQKNPGGTAATTTYTYTTAVSNGDIYYVFWMEGGRVRVHSGGAVTAINQVSGSDWVNESISIDKSSIIIFGADVNYVGPGFDHMTIAYFFNYFPSTFAGDFTTLQDPTIATTMHDLFSEGLDGYSEGTWTGTFSIPYVGAYAGHSMDWSSGALDEMRVSVSYNGSAFTPIYDQNGPIPNFPLTGTLGSTQVNGPFQVRVWLGGYFYGKYPVAKLKNIKFRVYADANFKSEAQDHVFVSQTHGTALAESYVDPSSGIAIPTANFLVADRLEFPSQMHKSIEFTALLGGTSGEILCARENSGGSEANISVGGGTLNWTGFDTVWLNGVSVSSGASYTQGLTYHLVALKSAGINSKINFGAHYTGTSNPLGSGLFTVAVYDRVLTSAEIAEHYQASRGLILGKFDAPEALSLLDINSTYIYSYAWEQTGAPI